MPKSEVNALTEQMTSLQVTRPQAPVAVNQRSKKRTIDQISKDATEKEIEDQPKKTRKLEVTQNNDFDPKEELKVGEKS